MEVEKMMGFKTELDKNYSKAVVLNWGAILTLWGHSAMPRDVLGVMTGGEGLAPGS